MDNNPIVITDAGGKTLVVKRQADVYMTFESTAGDELFVANPQHTLTIIRKLCENPWVANSVLRDLTEK